MKKILKLSIFINLLLPSLLISNNSFIQIDKGDPTSLINSSGDKFIIRGISFGNSVWMNPGSSQLIDHHGPEDYKRIKELGFNSVRFYINYGLFESDSSPYKYREEGFKWIDDNIKWAKEAGVLILLNMHYPQGGYQSLGTGDLLWIDSRLQKRLVKLWEEIAKRYRNEDGILGYGILNEPIPVNGVSQWSSLGNEIIKHIRRGDREHLIFVERALYSKSGVSKEDEDSLLFPEVKDPFNNLVYEFHFYSPLEFTHQNASWLPDLKGDFYTYPDDKRLITDDITWKGFSNGVRNFQGSSEWEDVTNEVVYIDSDEYKIGKAVVQVANIGDSILYFDNIVVDEYDPKGKLIGRVFNSSVDRESHWHFWSKSGEGYRGISANKGSSNNRSILVKNTTSDANLTSKESFILKKGYGYKISGRLKGNPPDKAVFRLRIDYYQSDKDVFRWNRDFLESSIKEYVEIGKKNSTPLYLGEFGVIRDSFNSGGYLYLKDLFQILNKYGISYNYHTYNEYNFGFKHDGMENSELAKIFKEFNY